MNIKWLSIFILLIPMPISATEIYDFKSGLICPANNNKKWVCHQSQDVYITGQGRCSYNNKPYHCTWYGFSFRYRDNKPGTKLVCNVSQSGASNYGNPQEVISENSSTNTYEIPLNDKSGYFINPQFSVFKASKSQNSIVTEHTICTVNNKHATSFTFNYHYPIAN